MLRALVSDVDLTGGAVFIRRKMRVRGMLDPHGPDPAEAGGRPAGVAGSAPECPHLFCQAQRVTHSRTKRLAPTAVTKDEANDHFKRTVAGSKWEALRGYHVLRHSFVSALASEAVDQRVIDEVVGHQSEEQRKRYRDLYPGATDALGGGADGDRTGNSSRVLPRLLSDSPQTIGEREDAFLAGFHQLGGPVQQQARVLVVRVPVHRLV